MKVFQNVCIGTSAFIKENLVILLAVVLLVIVGLISSQRPVEAAAGTPDAVDDTITVYQDSGAITINWIANDDMDDNATLDSFDSSSINSAVVSDNADGTFTYTTPSGFSGGDGFTYTICDDDMPTAECDTASVSVTVVATTACLTGFYQTLSGEINILDTTSTPASYVSAATDLGELNATGFNPNDGLIYGYSSNLDQVVSFDPNTGVFTNVYSHTEDDPFAGDMDSSNTLYYSTSSSTTLYAFNTVSGIRSTITLPSSHGVADFAYVPNDDKFYGVQSNGDNVAVIDLSGAPSVTTQAITGAITSETGGFGATWVTGNDTLYAFNNNSGNIFSIDTTTWASTYVTNSGPNGSNDGMSCAAGTSPFDISAILDYGDAPDTYGTLLASTGASAVINTSYRLGNFAEIDADGQPSVNADADDLDDIGTDEDGAYIGVSSLSGGRIVEAEPNTVDVKVPLNNGFVSMWIDLNTDGDFGDAGEQVATDVAPSAGEASLSITIPSTTTVPFDSFARVRLAARTGGTPTGLFSFGEVEDYKIEIYPTRPTITNDALSDIPVGGDSSYTVTGVCTDDGDSVVVSISDGSNPAVTSAATTCSSGTYSRTLDVSGLDDGTLTVTSTIDDTYNDPVSDIDVITKDVVVPTITQAAASDITNSNAATYPVSGVCTADGDAITVTLTDSDSPVNTASNTTTCSSGTYATTVNAGSLIDGMVNVESSIDDGVNAPVTDDEDIDKDVVLPAITQAAAPDITASNVTTYPVSGVCTADGDTITITLTDSDSPANTVSTATSCSSGTYSATVNASGLIDGNVNVESSIDDGVNPAVTDDEDVTKDADVPTVMNTVLNNVSDATKIAHLISGTCYADGDTVVVTVSDSVNPDVVSAGQTCTSSAFMATLDLSSLDDGSLTVTSVITDGVGNTANDADPISKDVVIPTITIDTPVEIEIANIENYPVTGTCSSIGDAIEVVLTDGENSVSKTVACVDNGGSGEYAAIIDASILKPGTIDIDATINDGINLPVTVSDDIVLAEDLDEDDTSSEIEKAGPNNGDGNNDGTPDYLQTDVTTKVNPIVDAYVTTQVSGDCDALSVVDFEIEPNLAAEDPDYDYTLGLHGFETECGTIGGDVTVVHYWDQEYDTSTWQYRKFIESSSSYVDFEDQVTYGTATVGDKTVTTVTFTLTDGGEYDSDGVANGRIVDPVGPAFNDGLSDTGTQANLTIVVGAALFVTTTALTYAFRQQKLAVASK